MVTVGQHMFNTLLILAYKFLAANLPPPPNVHPEEQLGIREEITSHGYRFEEHQLQTADGYLLTLFRLSSPAVTNFTVNKETPGRGAPVLIVHGILSSAQDFIHMGPNVSMAYALADSGYDVWLANCRGNTWSRKHVKYDPGEARFWKFSFHELGYYDIPAKLDYVANATGHDSIYYVGHSQGATSLFVTASERPEYIKRVRLFVALAPVVYPKAMPSVFSELGAFFYKQLEWYTHAFEEIELLPRSKLIINTFGMITSSGTPLASLFRSLVYANLGYSHDFHSDLHTSVLGSFPAGASSRQFMHYLQNKLADSFRKYDHGPMLNMKVYGQRQPPKYNMRTKMPTAIFYSRNDWLSTIDDVERICTDLKNLKLKYEVPGFPAHHDYIFGSKTNRHLYSVLHRLFQEN